MTITMRNQNSPLECTLAPRRGAPEMVGKNSVLATHSHIYLFLGEADGTAQVGTALVRDAPVNTLEHSIGLVAQVGVAQVRATKPGAAQYGPVQVRPGKGGATQIRIAQIGAPFVRATLAWPARDRVELVDAAEVDTAQIGAAQTGIG